MDEVIALLEEILKRIKTLERKIANIESTLEIVKNDVRHLY